MAQDNAMAATGPMPVGQMPPEPLLEVREIQGNVFPGFNKDYQTLLSLRITDVGATKRWLRDIESLIATVEEVLAFNRLFRALRARRKGKTHFRDPHGLAATWINVAFSYDGLKKLVPAFNANEESAFSLGMPARSALLGDPTDPEEEGFAGNWVVGGPEKVPHILVIVASDDARYLTEEVRRIKRSAAAAHLEQLYEDRGRTIPGNPSWEHFGFADGVSQPGVRGRVSDSAEDYLTDRYLDPFDPRAAYMGKPGQLLVWPGEFVLGYPTQNERDPLLPETPRELIPNWLTNGSYLVYRRLRQDVEAFHAFVRQTAAQLAERPGFADMTPQHLAALLVGRWPSGAPLMRSPQQDDPMLGNDDFANNHFYLGTDTLPVTMAPGVPAPSDNFPQAQADPLGLTCPHAAHIRKVNPRDQATEMGASAETLQHRILRRGIPFDNPLRGRLEPRADLLDSNKGLLFVCYQASIERQFEFLCNAWMNDAKRPRNPGGHDLLVGQNGMPGENRVRRCYVFAVKDRTIYRQRIETHRQWVIPTGGGYFFAPSISAIRTVLAAPSPAC